MENLKQKYQALQALLEDKFIRLSKHLAKHFFLYLCVIAIPPMILGVALCHQQKEVQQATTIPLLTKKEVKKLEAQVAAGNVKVKKYKHTADSLKRLGDSTSILANHHQQLADSLKLRYDQVPASTASAAELTSYLANYTPKPLADSL